VHHPQDGYDNEGELAVYMNEFSDQLT